MTLELLAHAGVIHQLAMFICFPHLPNYASAQISSSCM